MLDVDAMLKGYFPGAVTQDDKPLMKAASSLLKRVLHQDEINRFIETHRHLEGLEFNDAVLEHFNFAFQVSSKDRVRIPDQRRVLIVANHPLGSLDGLALLKLVSEIRTDVKIVATSLLNCIDPLRSLFLSVDNFSQVTKHRDSMNQIVAALEAEQAVIVFPTGEVSRISPLGVRDGKWKSGFISLAKKTKAPIVPVHIGGKNSAMFYGLSSIYKPLGTMMLVNEMFNQQGGEISFRIGKPIPWESIAAMDLSKKDAAKLMRKQVYLLGKKKKKELFKPVENIIHPVRTKQIRKELKASQLIGKTQDGKHIYLFDYQPNSSVMREIGRLRELSFRQVQEGTGNALDIDSYDRYYRHLILWDEDELEIIGSYRIGEVAEILKTRGEDGLYTHSLFKFGADFLPYLQQSVELGRSFIQPRYQNKRSLDYLWYGIGAYLHQYPEIRYLTGPVSMSTSLPKAAQQTIAGFYHSLFGNNEPLVEPRLPFSFDAIEGFTGCRKVADEAQYKQAIAVLKERLDEFDVKLPVLYKQYVELCEPGGCEFLGFNIDPQFSNCVDALILVHIDAIKEKKFQRYIGCHAESTRQRHSA
ncbi:lysophospholipid acyltransferase family protein [Nitrosomonas sp. sh817]|uniref:lysophospholipid acyltransferase family protein n=1 Tax=Nitrosomonas sp. sh817 TaxID=3070658 RepID=UPI0027DD5C82|nr:lysophospholipid acyltransferase family protein [Nitrosomonas sp. sh817]WMJ08181.1 lysophospholipid acyltransferase family protein [Nitrosomonas sp. sh817]